MSNWSILTETTDESPVVPDTSEKVVISPLALLKMLKHGKDCVPMEVMGVMLGEFQDLNTVKVLDVFAMPRTGFGISVEAIDSVYIDKMLRLRDQIIVQNVVVGWYHSLPGNASWLTDEGIQIQRYFEDRSERAVVVVISPIKSVNGKVVANAFRLIDLMRRNLRLPQRQTTSVLGHLAKPTYEAWYNGLNSDFYALIVCITMNRMEQGMLLSVRRISWMDVLAPPNYTALDSIKEKNITKMLELLKSYRRFIEDETKMPSSQLPTQCYGRQDSKSLLEKKVLEIMGSNIEQILTDMINLHIFK